MTLNRTEIMTAAWNETREMMRFGYAAHQLCEVFTYCLCRAYHAAKARAVIEAEAQVQADFEEKRDLIQSAKGRFAAVTFVKKGGSTRVKRVQPAKLKYHVKGDTAAPSARQAVETRKARHPHLMAVWDADKAAPRSINLATVTEIQLDGLARAYEVAA